MLQTLHVWLGKKQNSGTILVRVVELKVMVRHHIHIGYYHVLYFYCQDFSIESDYNISISTSDVSEKQSKRPLKKT